MATRAAGTGAPVPPYMQVTIMFYDNAARTMLEILQDVSERMDADVLCPEYPGYYDRDDGVETVA